MEVEDLHLCCVDMKAEAAIAQEQVAPLVARVKELEEELTQVASDQDTFRSRAKEATASAKLEKEASKAAEASRVEVQGWKEKAEASWVEAQCWEEKAKELEKEVTRAAEASVVVQAVLEAEIKEHNALQSVARTVCEALESVLESLA
ncbi:uncharacterized protein [Miscanthus floridulus]|uniref:uncharacterized protein n=1 Tax=Miscanthus floridulus TaxID=154761 RepID=UPI0034585514